VVAIFIFAQTGNTETPIYVRASDTFGKLDIDPRKIEKTPHHHRPPWIETNIDRYDLELCSIGRGASDDCFRQETACILENKYKHHIKVYTDWVWFKSSDHVTSVAQSACLRDI
jgi:hypothetical protein